MGQAPITFSLQYIVGQLCILALTTSLMYSLVVARSPDPDGPIVVPRSFKEMMNSQSDGRLYFIGKRNTVRQTKATCQTYRECPYNHCCAYGEDVKQASLLFPLIKAQPFCQPMGSVGDLCYSSLSQEVAFGCGCEPGNTCVTFVGYPYGICVEDRK